MTFTDENYRAMADEMRRSAAHAAPVLLDWLTYHVTKRAGLEHEAWQPRRVIDVGCGPGYWAANFAQLGCAEVLGVDGPDGGRMLRSGGAPRVRYVEANIGRGLLNARGITPTELPIQWDLALCLEVGEHLPADDALMLVEDLRCLAPVVLFSAAIPGQGGVGHVNEQWPEYWASMFRDSGWHTSGRIRRVLWWNDDVAPYYAQNLFVAWEPGRLSNLPNEAVASVVHPRVWSHVTGRG